MYKEMKDHPGVVMIFNPFAEKLIRKYVFLFLNPDHSSGTVFRGSKGKFSKIKLDITVIFKYYLRKLLTLCMVRCLLAFCYKKSWQ